MALGPGTGRLLSGSVVRGFRADGRGQGPAVSASSGTLPFAVMPGLVPGIHVPPPPRPLPARTPIPQRNAANETLRVELGACGQGLNSRPVGRRGERWGRHAREPDALRQAASRPPGPNRYRTVACLPAAGVGSGSAVFIQDPGRPRCAAEAFGANGRSPCDSSICRNPMKKLVPDDGLEPPTC